MHKVAPQSECEATPSFGLLWRIVVKTKTENRGEKRKNKQHEKTSGETERKGIQDVFVKCGVGEEERRECDVSGTYHQ